MKLIKPNLKTILSMSLLLIVLPAYSGCPSKDSTGIVCPDDSECTNRECGPDPVCGFSCGDCDEGETCNDHGECITDTCVPDCTGRVCGPDPVCGVSCGDCDEGETCNDHGECITDTCMPDCTGRVCGPDPVCGFSCGDCDEGETCNEEGRCIDLCEGVDCSGFDGPCTEGFCDPDTGECFSGNINEDEICDDGDPCTLQGTCRDGLCDTEPVVCDEPYEDICISSDTLRVYHSLGTCDPADGTCTYGYEDHICSTGFCSDGECSATIWTPVGSLAWSTLQATSTNFDSGARAKCADMGGRLPTISEMRTIITNCEYTQTGGECGITDDCLTLGCGSGTTCSCDWHTDGRYSYFGDTESLWSYSSVDGDYTRAWYVSFSNAYINDATKGAVLHFRCVKDI